MPAPWGKSITQSWIKPNNFQGCGKWGMMVRWENTANEIMHGSITDCWQEKSSFHLLKIEIFWISATGRGEGNGTDLCIYSWNGLRCNTTCNTTKAPWSKKCKFCFSGNPSDHTSGRRSRFQNLASIKKYFWCSLSLTWGANSYWQIALGNSFCCL